MNVTYAQDAKRALEQTIRVAVLQFEESTGLRVERVELDRDSIMAGGQMRYGPVRVAVEVRL